MELWLFCIYSRKGGQRFILKAVRNTVNNIQVFIPTRRKRNELISQIKEAHRTVCVNYVFVYADAVQCLCRGTSRRADSGFGRRTPDRRLQVHENQFRQGVLQCLNLHDEGHAELVLCANQSGGYRNSILCHSDHPAGGFEGI